MKIFVSWSGERSRLLADSLRKWLLDVFQDIEVWMSGHDLNAGARWGVELNAMLEASDFGILCLTRENLGSPWILFEAGALGKSVKAGRVAPYLLDLAPTDVEFPLAQFQGVQADRTGTFHLVESINSVRSSPLDAERLQRAFARWWPDMEESLRNLPKPVGKTPPLRSDRELLEELLELVRRQRQEPQEQSPQSPLMAGERNMVWTWGEVHHASDYDTRLMSQAGLEAYIKSLEAQLQTATAIQSVNLERNLAAANRELSRRQALSSRSAPDETAQGDDTQDKVVRADG